ncbi:RICIN domain-containing protein [Streptomyces rubradiris]|uniref:Ricin-type beta-trefoil lectin domain-containing protein n=1 Tax=Streptomyces rubradiris TaxID=285531 RepID=A0ABQ3R867_STRRR|nr:actinohivin [Streptomyces rubradiris]GHH31268.1 hypothetical protein GCM10018792_78840 [Streptomyces rubradiris]GHI52041.1 hypothetical protein Srubr_18870 [Streptomyces rubradiris]
MRFRHLLLAAAALVAIVLNAVPASAAPATEVVTARQPISTAAQPLLQAGGAVTTTVSPASVGGMCLDDSLAYGLRVITCNGTRWQLWSVGNPGLGYAMQNLETGRCVDDSSAYGLRAFPCNGMTYQFFASQLMASDVNMQKRTFQNVNTGACMDYSSPYGLRGFPCNGTQYQNWWVRNLL